MQRVPTRLLLLAAALAAPALAAPRRAGAQHEGHGTAGDTTAAAPLLAWRAGLVPQVVRATPTAGRRSLGEGYLSHPTLMLHLARGAVGLHAMANLEGLTLRRGELATGIFGEGYVDRRHPHTYVHELMATAGARVAGAELSLAAGRGFAPFGSDDPLSRPLVRFPINHHLSQILERLLLVGAARAGTLGAEVGVFNGDEPTGPADAPRWRRFGDSWAARLTWAPRAAVLGDAELTASYAALRAPEDPFAIMGLDQRKVHAGLRLARPTPLGDGYALLEWARTDDYAGRRRAFRYATGLAEAALCTRRLDLAARVERTAREEEERLEDLFRTPVPHSEAQIVGITRWAALTLHAGTPRLGRGILGVAPFVEATWLRPEEAVRHSTFDPPLFYGGRDLWQLAAGVRIDAGAPRARMGRYGAAARSHAHGPGTPRC